MLHDLLTSPQWPDIGAGRFAAMIRRDAPVNCRVAIVGLPDDLGVRMNNGRAGAAGGPAAFRAALARFGSAYDADTRSELPHVFDAGDITPAKGEGEAALFDTHRRVTNVLLAVHQAGLLPVCIGGGHDLSFPAVRALAAHTGSAVGGVNIDPHLDVRETPGSGMPFRALIEGGQVEAARFSVLGVGRFANARAHTEWLASRGGTMVPIANLTDDPPALLRSALARAGHRAFVSFDMDSLDASAAPGVSAPNPAGLNTHAAATMCEAAGADQRVGHFDIMELCPPHDADGRTARAAALLFLSFLAGFSRRDAHATSRTGAIR